MKAIYSTKELDQSTLDVDSTGRRVKVGISRIGNIDHSKQMFAPHAWTRTIKDRGPQGSNEVWHLVDHSYSLTKALGKPKELYVGANGKEQDLLVMVTDIASTNLGNDMLEHYKNAAIDQHSVSYFTPENERSFKKTVDGQEYELLGQSMLLEGSAVLWGDNPATPTLSVGKAAIATQAMDRLTILEKCLRSGRYTDEFFSLIELQIRAIKQLFIDLEAKANQPATTIDTAQGDRGNSDFTQYFTERFKL